MVDRAGCLSRPPCPLWAKRVLSAMSTVSPLYPRLRWSRRSIESDATCQFQTEGHRSKMPINSTIYGRVPESLRAILSKPTDRKRLQSNMRTGAPPFGELAG